MMGGEAAFRTLEGCWIGVYGIERSGDCFFWGVSDGEWPRMQISLSISHV